MTPDDNMTAEENMTPDEFVKQILNLRLALWQRLWLRWFPDDIVAKAEDE